LQHVFELLGVLLYRRGCAAARANSDVQSAACARIQQSQESNQLNWLSKQEAEPAADPRLPDFGAWTLLLENGKAEELGARLSGSLRELAADRRFGASVLQAYYLGFLQMVYYCRTGTHNPPSSKS